MRRRGQNGELEHRVKLGGRAGAVRLLGYENKADMGVYRVQNQLALRTGAVPDITAHPLQRTFKYGVGGNFEQAVAENVRVYGRFGWNEGRHESYAYTEVDQTVAVGGITR